MPINEDSSKEEVLAAVAQDGLAFRYASDELRANREVVLTAVAQFGWALEYASAELRADRDVVLTAVAQYGRPALHYASPALQADREVALAAKRGQGHEDVLLAAILNNPSLIQFFPTIPDGKIKTFFKDSCRAKTLPLPTYIDKNSLDKIQLFIKAQGNNHFIVKLPNDNEIDYEFKTSLAEQMLGAINGQLSLEPEPEHSKILIRRANHCYQLNPVYFEKTQISLYGFFLPVLRKTAVSKIRLKLLSILFKGFKLEDWRVDSIFRFLTIKDLSKYMQVCRAMRRGFFIKEVVADSASPLPKAFIASPIVEIKEDYFKPTSAEAAEKAEAEPEPEPEAAATTTPAA